MKRNSVRVGVSLIGVDYAENLPSHFLPHLNILAQLGGDFILDCIFSLIRIMNSVQKERILNIEMNGGNKSRRWGIEKSNHANFAWLLRREEPIASFCG